MTLRLAQGGERFTFESFVGGHENAFAAEAARRMGTPERAPFNPLFIHGPVGAGKTHLLRAIEEAVRAREGGRRAVRMTAEQFAFHAGAAARHGHVVKFRETMSADVLLIDDMEFLRAEGAACVELCHVIDAAMDDNRRVVAASARAPSGLDGIGERLRSRLGGGLVADIEPPGYELRLAILRAKAPALGAHAVPETVLEYLAHRIASNVRELEGALRRLAARTGEEGRSASVVVADDVLADVLEANTHTVSIRDIQVGVAAAFDIGVAEMHSDRRARDIARPRQVAMYLAKRLTPCSLPEIGRAFGGRDHTTVMHAVSRIEELIAADVPFGERVDALGRVLGGERAA